MMKMEKSSNEKMNNVVMILNKNVLKSLIFITVYIMLFSCKCNQQKQDGIS